MKVAYVVVLPELSLGIFSRILDKAKSAQILGLSMDFFIFNLSSDLRKENLSVIKANYKSKFKFINKILFKAKALSNLDRIVSLSNYDFIILRYPLAEVHFGTFLDYYGEKTISEHHTREEAELLSTSRLLDKFRFLVEKFRGVEYLRKVKAVIGVTNEIRKYELSRIGEIKPSTVISNGICVEGVPFTKFKKFDGKELNIVFIASRFSPWHGLTEFANALEKYKGGIKIVIHLVGEVHKKDLHTIKKIHSSTVNFIFHGYKNGKALDDIYSNSTIAISSLAINKKLVMKEACPLKTREYMARGIPFIYGYQDVDLTGNEGYALSVDLDSLNIEDIIEFAYDISNTPEVSEEMRNFALQNMDTSVKIKQIFEFCESIKNSSI